ncbi:hypothetical protein [Dyella solisilvae]|uniref:hypothetical protein n=1 Tax=Dyella solisilvae TaxID=1920168 RepID=UPI0011C01EE4|nr:hypothetical protein [Dyella solisilvae]
MQPSLCQAISSSHLVSSCLRAPRVRLCIAAYVLAVCGLSAEVADGQTTDSQGFVTNWPGIAVARVNGNPLPLSTPGGFPPLSVSASDVQDGLCSEIQNVITAKLKLSKVKWDNCKLPASLETRIRSLGPNQFGLKVIAHGVAITLDYAVQNIGTATFNITGDFECDSVIAYADIFTGASSTKVPPATVQSATATLSNLKAAALNLQADFASSASGPVLDSIQKQEYDGSAIVASVVAAQNSALNATAIQAQQMIRTKGIAPDIAADPNADAMFMLNAALVPGGNLVYSLIRNSVAPPAPVNCSGSATRSGGVEVVCYSIAPSGAVTYDATSRMRLERLSGGSWQVVDNGLSNSWDLPPPRAALPLFEDPLVSNSQPTATSGSYRVVAYNDRGPSPGATFKVTPKNLSSDPPASTSHPDCGAGSAPFARCTTITTPPGIH